MTAIELLKLLNEQGITLSVDGGDLRISAPKGSLTDELRSALVEHKSELIELLGRDTGAARLAPLTRIERVNNLPLSFAQARLWFLDQLDPGNSLYNIPSALKLSGQLDTVALEIALNHLIERHELLRAAFVTVERQPAIQLRDQVHIPLLQHEALDDEESELAERLTDLCNLPFRLDQPPLIRAHCIRLGPEEHILLLVVHHIIADGGSLAILLQELATVYARATDDKTADQPGSDLPLPDFQYVDYAAWQRELLSGPELDRQLDYWRKQLENAPPLLDIPADRPRPSRPGNSGGWVTTLLPTSLQKQLNDLARSHGNTLYMVVLAAFQVLLLRWTRQEDLVVGTPVAGRQHSGTEDMLGLFVNSLIIRSHADPQLSFNDLLTQVGQTSLDALTHQELPFEKLVEELQTGRDTSYAPLFQVLFNFQNRESELTPFAGLEVSPVIVETGTAKFDLSVMVEDRSDGLAVWFEYSKDLFDTATIERMAEHYVVLLEGIVANPNAALIDLPLMREAERTLILEDWNATAADYPRDATLISLFEAQVAKSPDAIALCFGDQALSYAELNRRANQLGHYLRENGTAAESLVGIFMERSIEMVVAIYGILKAGGAYVPLDPDYPQQRLEHMLRDAGIEVLLTQAHLTDRLGNLDGPLQQIVLDQDWHDIADSNGTENPTPQAGADHAAYVIFTSGSTGQPKGVLNEHRGICNRLLWMQAEYQLNHDDCVIQKTPFSFDVSVWEFFWPLLNGARLVIAEAGGHRDSDYLCQLIQAHDVSTIHFVPSMLETFLHNPAAADCRSLQRIICSGEALSNDVRARCLDILHAELHNLYGPTEAAIDVTYWDCQQDHMGSSVPIGHPVANTQIYIVDSADQPVPIGVPGELLIGGAQVARGYVNQPELTAERFQDNPFGHAGRIYRTGDLARFRPDGSIEFLGRIDFQVKLRGFRIELGEIEAELLNHPRITQAVVIMREDTPNDQRLVAYVVGEATATELSEHLGASLPDYMVPAAFLTLDALPLTANGKLDRRALPAPDWRALATTEYTAPRSPVEATLAEIWQDLLNIEQVGIHDDFFALGGHSLLGTQLISRIRDTLDRDLALRALFETPTISGIAALLEQQQSADLPELQVGTAATAPLAPAQQRIWILEQLEPGNSVYNIPWATRLFGSLDQAALQAAIDKLVERHQALRTSFVVEAGSPVQKLADQCKVILNVIDLHDADDNTLQQQLTRLARKPFPLDSAPLLRVNLLRLNGSEHVLQIVIHHIIADGWSMDVLLRELTSGYAEHTSAQGEYASQTAALGIQYADYARWQLACLDSDSMQHNLEYWRQNLAGAPAVIDLPLDHPRPPVQTHAGAWQKLQLPPDLTRRLKTLARENNASLFMVLLSAFNILLARHTGQDDLVIGTPIAGRQRTEFEELIGLFINTLVVRSELHDNPDFIEVLQRVKQASLDAFAHQDFPFEKLVEELQPARDTSYSPVFQVMFSLQNSTAAQTGFVDLTAEPVLFEFGTAKFDLTLAVEETGTDVTAYFEYNTDLFDSTTIATMAMHWHRLLQQITAAPTTKLNDYELLSADERQRLLTDWNSTSRDHGPIHTLHELFSAQVSDAGDAIAVECAATQLSYRELDERANQLAHHLIALGAGDESLVGICMDRSSDLLVALLAVLKSGSAYVPLDPEFPVDRLHFMLEDSGTRIVISETGNLSLTQDLDLTTVCLDASPEIANLPVTPPQVTMSPDQLAYVIYTSGSTGKPKGVAIEHGAVVNFLSSMLTEPGIQAHDRLLAVTTLSFDISILELFGPLAAGATTVVASRTTATDGYALGRAIRDAGITVMQATPATWRMLLQSGWRGKEDLKILSGGEALDVQLATRLGACGSELWNMYGPTETTIWSTCQKISTDADVIDVGRPIANTRCYILDPNDKPVPIGVAGELVIGGSGVARGYLNQPELTAERFVADPFNLTSVAKPRMYKTGDLARYRSDGSIQVLGRTDFQVKLRGFRIELGEIEASIGRLLPSQQCVVMLREDSPGDQRLVAYLAGDGAMDTDVDALRTSLRADLPDYMLPAAFVVLDEFPLTPNAKVDRKQLPKPEWDFSHAYVAPRNKLEQQLADIWADVLNLEQVGIHDDFFDLGGHSLLATRLISRIYDQLNIELSLLALFNQRNVAELAEEIERLAETAQESKLTPVTRADKLPLSFAQQRLWFLDELSPGDPMYNIPWVMRLRGAVNIGAMQAALNKVIDRHESLRTTFPSKDGEPVQLIADHLSVTINVEDLSKFSQDQIQQRLTELAQTSMNLRTGPLLRFSLLQVPGDEHLLSLVVHHIIFDAWSHNILLRELAGFYNAELEGTRLDLPDLPIEFADYASWQRDWLGSKDYLDQLEFWKTQLGDAPGVLELHTDKPRPPVQTSNGANAFRMLPEGLLEAVRKLSVERGCTLFAVLMAAFNVLMSRYAGQDDIVIGTPIAGRKRTELEAIVGFFLHTLAIRGDLSGNPSFVEFLERLNRTVLEAFANQELPFETLVEALDPERDTSRSPIFQVMFVLQHVDFDWSMFNELKAEPVEFEFGTAKYDIMFFVFDANDQLSVRLEYNTDLFEPATIERMIDHFTVLLAAIVADANQTVGELPLLTTAEEQQLLVDWNQTGLDYPAGDTMHGLFEKQVGRTPDASALWTESETLTYLELNRRANKMAAELRQLGVGPEVLVALCTERCTEMIVAMLAIQKAGGAYVPIDPQYPPQRVAHMLNDSAAPVLLTQTALLSQLPDNQARVICLDSFDWITGAEHDANPASGVGEQQLGYTIYTSGSTGMPKGVEIEHRNAVALMRWAGETFSAEEFSGVLASTSICFDLSVFEIFCPLAVGGRIILVEDALALPALPESAHVTLINTVPSAIAELVRIEGVPPSVKTVNLAGEPLSTALVNSIYALGTVAQVNDLYGPSEDTTYSTWTRREANALPTIGRPIANTEAYLLDSFGQPVPIGVAGELYLGGAGVTRGYRNHSELTAEKYIADRFSNKPAARMFRTGDQARYRADGNLEFIGRLDHQVKLRGFRIELGEIETALASHSAVENTVVMAREDRKGDKRLVAYIVAGTEGLEGDELEQWESEQVSQWQDLWQDTYQRESSAADPAYDFKGWISSYDSHAIPEPEMRIWLDSTTERINAYKPDNVIEIGSGTGLIVGQIAPGCSSYVATDFSAESVNALRLLQASNSGLEHLEIRQCTADSIGEFDAARFDTVILNSVAQYFPDVDYLLTFLTDAADVVADNGRIFLGDLRSATLLNAYHTSVQLFQAEDETSLPDLAENIRQRTEQEEELLIDPAFFVALQKANPRITGVRYQLKRSTFRNELTRFRYDVILEVTGDTRAAVAPEHLDWNAAKLDARKLKAQLASCGPAGLLLTGVPDARLQHEVAAIRELENPVAEDVAALREKLEHASANTIEPEAMYEIADQLCLDVQMIGTQPGLISVLFRPGTEMNFDGALLHVPRPVPWRDYGNDPLHGRLQRSLVPILKDRLRKAVPEYMIPSAFVILDAFPLTPNGKINRKALPAPERKRSEKEIYVAPRTSVEEQLVAIWCDVLGIEQIGVHDDFFALGGHSLLATQLISRIRDGLRTELPLMALFNHPTVAGLAEALTGETASAASAEITRCDRDEYLPLSFAQQRLWFLSQLEGVSAAYNVPIALQLDGPLDTAALQKSVDELVQRHESLRTSIVSTKGKATQVIHRPTPISIDLEDMQSATRDELQQHLETLAQAPFDLADRNLIRVHVLASEKDQHILLLVMHHIVSDGWSLGVLARELAKLYAGFCKDRPVELPELAVQYVDYAVWQRSWLAGEELRRQIEYWAKQLDGAPTLLQLPTDRPRGSVQTFAGAHINRSFAPELSQKIRDLAAAEDSTLFMFLLAAFNALLARYTSSEDIVVGTPIAGRTRTEIEGLIGFFVNTLVMRNDLSDDPDFVELLQRVKQITLEAYSHQELPFEKLVEELQPERDTSHSPIFQVLFVLQENLSDDIEFHRTKVTPLDFELGSSKFDLSLFMVEFPEGLTASIEYNTDLFDSTTIERMLSQLENLLGGIVANPEQPVSQLPLLTAAEQQQVLERFNTTAHEVEAVTVHELVEAQVEKTPERIALSFDADSLTYSELNDRANRLAHNLISLGAGPGTLVGICTERSVDSLTAVLAVLKSGSAYVPIDPNYPPDRISYMLTDSQAPVLITQTQVDEKLPELDVSKLYLDQFDWNAGDAGNPGITGAPSVYAIYTSGSTGKPKGVELSHHGLANLIQWQATQPGLDTPARTLQFASLSFDVSFQELFTTWAQGGTLVLVSEELRRDLPRLAKFIASDAIERVYFPYAALQPLADSVAGQESLQYQIRDVVVAGEQLRITPAIQQMFSRLDTARLHNQYGPSETHVVTALTLSGDPAQWPVLPPIGTPVANTRVYVLDNNRQPVPVGVPGELYLGGVQVARGYIHRSALTREKFLPDTFCDNGENVDARMYRTGDRVRFLPDGNLEFLGRVDDQVKWRGFRIEPGEIEACITGHPDVQQSVVLLREDTPGNQQLVAYVVARDSLSLDTRSLADHVQHSLPAYMVPSAFVQLESIPVTPSGKLQRRALPAPDLDQLQDAGYVAPRNPIETALAQIWQDILGVERAGINDDFFRLGGHSLLATQVISRISDTLDVSLPLQTIFDKSVLGDLARTIQADQGQTADQAISPADRKQSIPLSFAQQRLWFLDQLEPENPAYHLYLPLRLDGPLDVAALKLALNDLVTRHETLRTHFAATSDDPIQIVAAAAELPLELISMPGCTQDELVEQLVERERQPFDLNAGPLIRASVFEHDEDRHTLLLVIHHIISDGWSLNVLQRELAAAYNARRQNRTPDLPAMPIQYADYAIWQRDWLSGAELDRQLGYWREQLADAPSLLDLPLDRPRPDVQSTHGAVAHVAMDPALTRQLKQLSQVSRTTLFMTLLAGLKVLFSRLSGQQDIVIGAPIAGRNRLETEALIGFFINALVMRTDLSGNPGFSEVLERVRATTLAAYSHQDTPFELLVSELRPDRDTRYSPLFQVAFSVETAAADAIQFDDLDTSFAPGDAGTTTHDMVFLLWDIDGQIRGTVRYNTDLFNADTIERLLEQYMRVLEAAAAEPHRPINELPLTTDAELHKMLVEWNQTDAEFPSDTTIHWLFEHQAQQTPEQIAVEYADERMSYAELDAKANQLAHHLIQAGIGRDDRVGLCIDRSPHMIIGILGIMKAGGAYVPMDPAYPQERLAYIAADCGAKLLLSDAASETAFAPDNMPALCLKNDWELISRQPTHSPHAACGPQNLAYVIYTSGSTGQPKGVMVEHRGVCNLATAQIKLFQVKPESRVLQFASFSFDASFSEIAMSLLSGATLVLADRDDMMPGEPILKTLRDKAITTVTLTPSVLVNTPLTDLPALDTIVTAGEACPPSVVAGWGTRYRLVNAYGPTETSVCATAGVCVADGDGDPPPIGRPIANVQVYLLDEQLQPVPLGATGELCVGGVGVTRGYLNRPELTAEKFVADPFSADSNARLYRTGDLARYRPDGNIDYIGRVDHQVKVRGFRIEPGEIEAALVENPDVREALVIAHSHDSGADQGGSRSNQQLVAYVVPEAAERELELWPSVAEFYVYDEALYYAMTHDERRNAAYVEAIRKTVPGKVVLDIGTGQDAILSRLCVAEGAQKVYAIELLEESYLKAKATIQRHGLQDKITLIHGNSFEVELPEKVDVCVSELVGAIGGSEGVAKIINDAHRYLKPGGQMIPELSETLIAAVSLPESFLERPGFSRATANYAGKIFDQVGYEFDLRLCIKGLIYDDIISDTGMFERLDHREQVPLEEITPLNLTINEDSRIDGFLVWLTLITAEGCTLIDSLENEHCWLPVYLPVFDPGIEVNAGDYIEAHIARTLCDNELNPDFRVYGKLVRQNSEDIEFDYDCFHYKQQFKATPFYARLFAGDDIPVAQSGTAAISAGTLRKYLQDHIPEHMIPASFVALNHFPLTPNGKIDRQALPAPGTNKLETDSAFVAPTTTTEQLMSRVWGDLLGVERIGVDDNFFELGGDSILSIQIIARAASKGLQFTPKQLFKHQTIRKLAAAIAGQAKTEILADQGTVTGPVALTPIQRWFLDADFSDPHHFNQGLLYESDESIDVSSLAQALDAVMAQHDSLRLSLKGSPDGWKQESLSNYSHKLVEKVDLGTLEAAERDAEIERLANQLQTQLNPIKGALLKALLFKRGKGHRDQLLIVIHHLAIDWVSWPILIEDISTAYRAIVSGAKIKLPPKSTSFQQWAERLAEHADSAEQVRELAYWKSVDWESAAKVPTDMQSADNLESSVNAVSVHLDTQDTGAFLTTAPAAYHAQANDLLLSAIALALSEWCNAPAVSIELEGHGREDLFADMDLTRTTGWFTSLYPALLIPDPDRSPGGTIKAIKEQLRAIPNRGIGFGLLRYLNDSVEAQQVMEKIPAPEVGYNYLGQMDQHATADALLRPAIGPTGHQHSPRAARSHLLDITGSVSGGKLYLSIEYSGELHKQGTIEQLAANILTHLQHLVQHCLSPDAGGYTPADFPLANISQPELDQLLTDDANVQDIYALTPLQQGMLFHSEFGDKSDAYFTQFAGDLLGPVDADCLRRSWQHVIDKHDVLRSSLHWQGMDHAVQVVHRDVPFILTEDNWSDISVSEIDQHFTQLMQLERNKGFVLDQPNLNRVHLIKTGPEQFRLLWSFHHALLDGWSIPLVLNELLGTYHDLSHNKVIGDQPTTRFGDYIEWLKAQDSLEAERFWRESLRGFNTPTPLPGVDQVMTLDPESAEYEEQHQTLPKELAELVQNVAQHERLTVNTLIQAAWALVLAHYTRSDDVVYGATTSGRPANLAGVESMIGQFLNTLPVRVQIDDQSTIIDWLRSIQEHQLSMRSYEYAALIDIQSWSDIPRGQQMFESLLAYENYPQMQSIEQPDTPDQIELNAESIAVIERTNYPLTFTAIVRDSITARMIYDTRAYDAAMVNQLIEHFANVLESIAANPKMRVGDVALIDATEQERVRKQWNAATVAYPTDVTLQGLFELQVARSPDAPALQFEDQQLSYAELNARANQLAHLLRERGVGPESLVGVCMERSIEMVVALYGILKSGGAYVPLDPDYPSQRLQHMCEDAHVALVLCQQHTEQALPDIETPSIVLDTDWQLLDSFPTNNPITLANPDNAAYVIFTSGSTGRPKGVVNEHRGICNRLLWMQSEYKLNANDRVLQKTPYSFDVSVWEFFWPLQTGAKLVVAKPEGHKDPDYLAALIQEHGITTLHFVPSMLEAFLQSVAAKNCSSIARTICSGEALTTELQNQYFATFDADLHNLYGPTEAAIDVSYWACDPNDSESTVPIGRPVANTDLYIVDNNGRPLPPGVPGELWIGGVQVARGYINRPDLTAERFISDPFSAAPEARLYRTGDLAKYRPDGAIEFLGRIDFQVKLRGYRIELGEIETELKALQSIDQAAVILREDIPGDPRLVAYTVGTADTETIREWLATDLPDYMIPSAFVALPELPFTVSGKLDRNALPPPDWSDAIKSQYVAPRTPTEETLAEIWQELLGVEKIGVHDDFFQLGGHSIIAMKLASRIVATLETQVAVGAVFATPTVSGLAAAVEASGRKGSSEESTAPIKRSSRRGKKRS